MSEYLSKKAVLEWFGLMHLEYSHNAAVSEFIESGIEIFESGAFDVPDGEVQRLRAALEEAQQFIHGVVQSCEITEFIDYGRIISEGNQVYSKISEALSTTEPTGAERVRDKMKSLFEAWDLRGICKDSLEGYEQGVMLELIGLCEEIAGINATEGDRDDA